MRLTRLTRAVGYRGAFLLFLAVLFGLYGFSIVHEPAAAFRQIESLIPVTVWAWLFMGTAALCVVQAPMRRDRLAYILAATLAAAWAAAFTEGWLIHHVPRAWVSVAIFGAVCGITLLESGRPEPPPKAELPEPRVDEYGEGR